MDFTPKPCGDIRLSITERTAVELPIYDSTEYIKATIAKHLTKNTEGTEEIERIIFSVGIPKELSLCASADTEITEGECFGERVKIEDTAKEASTHESYAIVFGKVTEVYANGERGFITALSTLVYLSDRGELRTGSVTDTPASAERGYRIYMPGRATFPDFVEMLDLLVYYKYNMLILEIGGAMEYERHPKINEKWVEFSREVAKYSGRSEEIQYSQHWKKNSIHYENGDGSYLTKDECREIARLCRERGIEIVPECPTLSHADYICLAYPELSERQDDPYPDTYCPENPESYRVVFDILDEVIEVFQPKRINIGHDEFYTVGICERCRGKNPAELYANDVRKINEYLKARGIGTMMWAEKLLKARMNYNGYKIGGWYDESDCNGVKFQVPDMWQCADLLPRDVTYLHWYWSFGEHLDDEFHARGMKSIFANFSAVSCQNYRTRMRRGTLGGVVSNWGSLSREYMQRNRQYFELVSTAYALTSANYDTDRKSELIRNTYSELYERYLATLSHPLTVTHRAHHSMKYKPFYCGIFIEDEEYLLGDYAVTYTDGTVAMLPVKYGTNIGPADADVENVSAKEASYSTLPIEHEGGCTYRHAYENPHPEGKIEKIEYIPRAGKEEIKVSFDFSLPD